MGKVIDHDHRYTQEEREYLSSRGRGYLIAVNERKYGTEDEPLDTPEGPQESEFYDNSVREKAVYDVGGAVLPGIVLDHDTGRAYDRENGVTVEYTGPGHTPGAYDLRVGGRREPEGFDSYAVDAQGNPIEDEDTIDEDIVEEVMSLPNVTALKKRLKEEGTEFSSEDKREDLENKLAIALQDKRDSQKREEAAQPGPQ